MCSLFLTMAACGGGSDTAADGKVHLRFTWWGSDERHAMTQELIDKFEASHPDIKIDGEFTGWDDYWDRLATSVAGGNTPDVMQQETRYVREYADRGVLADLNDYIPDVIDDAKLDPGVVKSGEVDGKMYAIPTGINAYSVVVNPQAFEKAGVDLPDDSSWTWDDLIQAGAQVTKASGGKTYGFQDMGFVDAGFQIFARQHGEDMFADDGSLGFSPDTLRDWWNTIVEMRDKKVEPQPSLTVETQSGGIDQSLLATGKGAGGFWWTNELPTLMSDSGNDLELRRFPGESTGQQAGMFLKPAMFYSVSSQSKHPKEAAEFVNFLLNDKGVAERQLSDRGLPINTDLRAAIEDKLQPADQQSAEFLAEITPDLADPPPLPPKGAGEVQDILGQLNEQVLFDRLSVDKAVEQFEQQVKSATG